MDDDLDQLTRTVEANQRHDLDGPTLEREGATDPLDAEGTVQIADPLVVEARVANRLLGRWCLMDARTGGGEMVIGRHPECQLPYWWFTGLDVQLPKVSRRHATIGVRRNGVFIADLGSRNGTFLSGNRIGSEAVKMNDGDELDLGNEFAVRIREARDTDGQLQCVLVRPARPQGSVGTCVLIVSAASIGTNVKCAIVLDHPTVSERHCDIALLNGAFWLRQGEDETKTAVNGKVLNSSEITSVKPGDTATLGDVRINVQAYDPRKEAHRSSIYWR
jgi:pSer/pThr/pTyr-binding forkhead associated (FHA) protein